MNLITVLTDLCHQDDSNERLTDTLLAYVRSKSTEERVELTDLWNAYCMHANGGSPSRVMYACDNTHDYRAMCNRCPTLTAQIVLCSIECGTFHTELPFFYVFDGLMYSVCDASFVDRDRLAAWFRQYGAAYDKERLSSLTRHFYNLSVDEQPTSPGIQALLDLWNEYSVCSERVYEDDYPVYRNTEGVLSTLLDGLTPWAILQLTSERFYQEQDHWVVYEPGVLLFSAPDLVSVMAPSALAEYALKHVSVESLSTTFSWTPPA